MSKVYLRQIDINEKVDINTFKNAYLRYHFSLLKNSHLVLSMKAWELLQEVLKEEFNLDLDSLEITENAFGKPRFENCPIQFNMSHCDNIIAIMIAGNAVGIDLERIRNFQNLELMAQKFHLQKATSEDVIKEFSKLEAFYKKKGTGIYPSTLDKKVFVPIVQKITINQKSYILSLAFDENTDGLEFIKWK